MSGLNRTEAYYSGLKVHNKGNNILHMNSNGKYSLKTDSIHNFSFRNLKNISNTDSFYKSIDGNLNILTDNGNIILKSGNNEILYNIKSELNNIDLEEENEEYIYFIDLENLNNLRNNSLLIESLKNPICLYGNYGINNISHLNYKVISDREIILQALRKIRINTLGTLSLNTEKIIGSCQEDIILISSEGNIKLGGDGVNNAGLVIDNENLIHIGENNIGDIGENNISHFPKKTMNINIKNKLGNSDGISILGNESNPELDLVKIKNNNQIRLSLGLGKEEKDINNIFFGKFITEDNRFYINSLDNFIFSLDDIGNNIICNDSKFEIIDIKNKNKAEINREFPNNDYQKIYINRQNCANLITKTNSNLYLGTNNIDILNFSKNGRLGINTKNIDASLHITNNYGKISNIRNNKNKKYFNYNFLQLQNTNFIIFAVGMVNEKYSLEAFLYNIDNVLIKHSILKDESFEIIDYDITLYSKLSNMFLIAFSYFTDSAVFINEISIFRDNLLKKKGITKKIINEDIERSGCPLIESLKINGFDGHIIVYRDRKEVEEYFLNIYNYKNELIFKLNLKSQIENYNHRNISNLLFFNNSIIFLDIYNHDGSNIYYKTTINITFFENNFIENNIHTEILNNILNSKLYILDNTLYTITIDNDKNLFCNYKKIQSNIENSNIYLGYIDGNHKILCRKEGLKIIDINTKNINELNIVNNSNDISFYTIKNIYGEYIKSILIWQTENEIEKYNSNSIIFKDFNSKTNLMKIENNNNEIEIKNNGDIMIKDIIEFSKQNSTTEIKNNLVLSEKNIMEEKGIQGQINHHNDELFIFLGNKWKKIKLEDI